MTLQSLCHREWDIAVIGAGPAGTAAARETARHGLSVLLIDKASFPRSKVCGGCLNQTALAELSALRLGHLPARLGGRPLQAIHLAAGRQRAVIPLPAGMALSRQAFDAALVDAAVEAGAVFLPETTAFLLDPPEPDHRRVTLRQGTESGRLRARLVLAADGLKGNAIPRNTLPTTVRPASRIGVGAIAPDGPAFYEPGFVTMACGKGGYLGLVRLEDGRLDAAAALDPEFIRQAGGPGRAAATLLAQTGLPAVENLAGLAWSGTPALSRRCLFPAAERLFLLGDAAGYVEPFTGQGMAWALGAGRAIGPLAVRAARRWNAADAQTWADLYRHRFARSQQVCRWTAEGLRHPILTQLMVALFARAPGLAAPWVRATNLS